MAKKEREGGQVEKSGSTVGFVVTLVLLVAIGASLGAAYKIFLTASQTDKERAVTASRTSRTSDDADKSDQEKIAVQSEVPDAPKVTLYDLKPIVTNIAKPKTIWVRLEASLPFEGEPEGDRKVMTANVSLDFLAFLRTVSLADIEGSTGLEYLTDDLSEIARIRTNGKVKRVIIRGFVVE